MKIYIFAGISKFQVGIHLNLWWASDDLRDPDALEMLTMLRSNPLFTSPEKQEIAS